jgi:hypothetical protein
MLEERKRKSRMNLSSCVKALAGPKPKILGEKPGVYTYYYPWF